MKLLSITAICALLCGLSVSADEEPYWPYVTVERFGIPTEFYTVHRYLPWRYLEEMEVADVSRELTQSEKLSAALLVVAANHATYTKFGQSYGVSMRKRLLLLLSNNFEGFSEVEGSHDVKKGAVPIRDLAAYMSEWLAKNTKI